MAILTETVGDRAFDTFDAFGANEDYCDKTYPPGASAQISDWNQRCKRSCSGLECIKNPGLLAKPWTIVGKNARGLPDSSILGTALSMIKPGAKPPTGAPAGEEVVPSGAAPGAKPSFFEENKNLILIGGGLAAVFLLMKRGGGRRRGGVFGGYSRRSRRTRRTARAAKRRS